MTSSVADEFSDRCDYFLSITFALSNRTVTDLTKADRDRFGHTNNDTKTKL